MRNSLKRSLFALAFAVSVAGVSTAHAQFNTGTISVDFDSATGGATVPAGQNAVLTPGTWNAINTGADGPKNSTGNTLVNSTGLLTTVLLGYTADGCYNVDPYLNPTERANSPNIGLLEDFLDSKSTTTPSTVTLSGLSLNTPYNLYLYAGGNADGRQTVFTIGTTTKTATFADADTTFVDGHNYVSYLGLRSSATGTITINFTAGAGGEGDFNGFQITPAAVPEPSTVAALGLGGMVLASLAARRRRVQA